MRWDRGIFNGSDESRRSITFLWDFIGYYVAFLANLVISGGWFGTWLLFFHSVGNVIIPTDELIFFRGVAKNHQK